METFLVAAGVVGFVASIDGVIGLCEKVKWLLDHVRHTKELGVQRARVGNICTVYLRLKEKLELEKDDMEEMDLESLRISTLVVHEKLTEILSKLQQASVVISQKKRMNKKLDEIDRVLHSYMLLFHLETRPATVNQAYVAPSNYQTATEYSVMANLLEDNKLLQRLMNPRNGIVIPKSTLRQQDWYSETLEVKPDTARCVVVEGKTYMVERIALGKTSKETERRLSRLGKLLMIMRESDDAGICNLLRMSKIVRGPENFCILSELEDASYTVLEGMLADMKDDQGWKVLLLIAEAVQSLHQMSLVHEGLNSQNILVHINSMEIKLTGFASSPEILDLSDCLTSDDPDLQKRNQIFQAPERLAGSRYSFECDVYSLGMVMAEMCLGQPLVQEPKTDRDDIMSLLEQPSRMFGAETQAQVVALIRDIVMAPTASKRPLALEITERLSRMGSRN